MPTKMNPFYQLFAKNVMSGLRFPSDRRFACFANQRFACFANRRDCKAPSDSFGRALHRSLSFANRRESEICFLCKPEVCVLCKPKGLQSRALHRRFAYPEGVRRRALQYGGLGSGVELCKERHRKGEMNLQGALN